MNQHLDLVIEFLDEYSSLRGTTHPREQKIHVQNIVPIGQKLWICINDIEKAFDFI